MLLLDHPLGLLRKDMYDRTRDPSRLLLKNLLYETTESDPLGCVIARLLRFGFLRLTLILPLGLAGSEEHN